MNAENANVVKGEDGHLYEYYDEEDDGKWLSLKSKWVLDS